MIQKSFLILLISICSFKSYGQYKDSVHIDLKSNNSIYEVVDMRVAQELKLLDSIFHFKPALKKQVKVKIYTLNQLYFEDIRHKNYTIEKMLLEQQVKFKNNKIDFFKFFLNKEEMKKLGLLIQKAAKKDYINFQKNPTEDAYIIKLRQQAAGWDLLNQTITLSD